MARGPRALNRRRLEGTPGRTRKIGPARAGAVAICLSPLGLVAAGATASLVGIRVTLVVGGIIGVLSGLALFVPGVRDPDLGRLP